MGGCGRLPRSDQGIDHPGGQATQNPDRFCRQQVHQSSRFGLCFHHPRRLWGRKWSTTPSPNPPKPATLSSLRTFPWPRFSFPKGVTVINPRGELYTDDNIRERLSIRNFMQDLREAGGITPGPKEFGQKEKQRFSDTFDRELTKHRKRASSSHLRMSKRGSRGSSYPSLLLLPQLFALCGLPIAQSPVTH